MPEEEIEETEEPKKKTKKKKVVRRRKSKKEKEKPLTGAIRLAVETGKVTFGARRGIKESMLAKSKLFVLASNAPKEIKKNLEQYSGVSGVPIINFEGTSLELGSVCGRPYPVSVLSVQDEGTSNILKLK